MIGALLSALFNLIMTLAGTILQIVLLPINALFNGVFPDLTNWINSVVSGFNTILSGLPYAISIIPPMIRSTILIILTTEIALMLILRSTKLTAKLWKLIQKIKIW